MLPRLQVERGVDGAVVAHEDQRRRVHLEMEVGRRPSRVAGVAHEAEHVAGPHVAAVLRQRRERGKVCVVELVPLRVAEPDAVAADVVPPNREDEAVRAGEDRRAERSEDVVAVVPVPGNVSAEGAEGVGELRGPVDREDVAARGERRVEAERRRVVGRARAGLAGWAARGRLADRPVAGAAGGQVAGMARSAAGLRVSEGL